MAISQCRTANTDHFIHFSNVIIVHLLIICTSLEDCRNMANFWEQEAQGQPGSIPKQAVYFFLSPLWTAGNKKKNKKNPSYKSFQINKFMQKSRWGSVWNLKKKNWNCSHKKLLPIEILRNCSYMTYKLLFSNTTVCTFILLWRLPTD